MSQEAIHDAKAAVRAGATVEDAAAEHGIDPVILRLYLGNPEHTEVKAAERGMGVEEWLDMPLGGPAVMENGDGDRGTVGVPEMSPNETTSDLREHANGDSRDTGDSSPSRRVSWTAAELLTTDFPEPKWAVPGFIPEGLTLLAGAPKVGKSWLSLGLGIAAATGGKALGTVDVEQGPTLYLALEDTARRLKSRLEIMTAGDHHPGLSGLTIAVECPPLPAGGDQRIADWLDKHPDARMVVIDVLSKIRGQAGGDIPQYDRDYHAVSRAKTLADTYGVAIVVVHHTRKMAGDDWMDEISGTRGISGAADGVLSLARSRGEADGILSITGRDVEESRHALTFKPDLGTWHLLDTPVEEIGLGDTRRAVLDYVRANEGARPKQASDELGLDYELTKKTCARMVKDGQLDTDGKGRYFVPYTPVPTVPAVPAAGQDPLSQGHPQGQLSLDASEASGADIVPLHPGSTQRVQVEKQDVGVILPAGSVYVGRANSRIGQPTGYGAKWVVTEFGNPHPVGRKCKHCDGAKHARDEAIELYREHLRQNPHLVDYARAFLAGKNLACWCSLDEPCHADVLLAVARGDDP